MARRKELKNIASGLYGSFVSRTNEIGGYWGIGKLCLLAQQSETRKVLLDLLARSVALESADFSKLVNGYYLFLQKQLATRGIPEEWVHSAIIELDFASDDLNRKHIPITTWGNLFKLTVAITDDMKKNHTVYGYSYCEPHNPRKESKSAGAERF